MKEKKTWYAVYTKPRWEKKVHAMLAERGIESYCPLNKVNRKWSDRIKVVMEPLFKSYVFIHISESEKTVVRMVAGVVNFVYWLGKPAVIRDEEIGLIRKFLREYEQIEVEALELKPRQKVKVVSGVLMDTEGEVVKVFKNKVVVNLYSLGYRMIATMRKEHLAPAKKGGGE